MADTAQSDGDPGTPVATAKGRVERIELGKRGQSSARRVAESKATVPHAYLSRAVIVGDEERVDAVVVAALGRALRERPELNAAYRDGGIERYGRRNVALTVEVDDGAVAPTLFDADQLAVDEVAEEIERLTARARAGALASPELAGSTFTVSFVGGGADSIAPAVVPGQASHLGVGRSRAEPAIRDGAVVATRVVELTLSIDQRAVRPDEAASFLEHLARAIEATPSDGL